MEGKHVFLIYLKYNGTFKHMVLFVYFYLNSALNIQLLRSLMAFQSSCTCHPYNNLSFCVQDLILGHSDLSEHCAGLGLSI